MFQKQNFLNTLFFFGLIFIFLFIPFFQSLYFFQVSGNFEWAKSIIFIILTSLLGIIFFFKEKKINIPFFILFFFFLLFFTSFFTDFPLTNLIGEFKRGQGVFFYMSLAFLFIFLKTLKKKEKNTLLTILLFTSSFFSLIALLEYFFPSGNYILENKRAFGTFGNPHHLTLYLLMLFPFFLEKIFPLKPQEKKKPILFSRKIQERYFSPLQKYKNNKGINPLVGYHLLGTKLFFISLFIINIFTLLLTKSFLGIFIFILYSFYFFSGKNYKKTFLFTLIITISGLILLFFFFPEKLHSLLARVFIWQSVITLIFSDIKIFLFGAGADTLSFLFGNFKSPSLYIFENFGFQADRPHNIFLLFFYQFGVFGFLFIFFIFSFILKNFKKKSYFESLIIFFVFLFFNIPSITTLMLFIFFLSFISDENNEIKDLCFFLKIKNSFIVKVLQVSFLTVIILLFSSLYIGEIYAYKNDFKTAKKMFPHPKYLYETLKINNSQKLLGEKSPDYFIKKILNFGKSEENCNDLLEKYPSGENYFFCGDILKQKGHYIQAKSFYRIGLLKLPDLRNENSPYWDKFFIKNTINGNRFFSEKYSNLREILFFVNQ